MSERTKSPDVRDRIRESHRAWKARQSPEWHAERKLKRAAFIAEYDGQAATRLDRMWIYVDPASPDDCWPWRGSVNNHGYGRLGNSYAHRLSWQFHFGPIPRRMVVMHACDHPPCVNPWHLRLGTQRENVADMMRKGRSRWGAR